MLDLLVLFGSETGNARDVAEGVWRAARRRGYSARLVSMDAYELAKLPTEPLAVFVTSTTGQGDPPRNMVPFWRVLLRRGLPHDALAGLQFAVFGLGDSGYARFNVAAKKLHRRLLQLGAQQLWWVASTESSLGLGDDQHPRGYEGSLGPWLDGLWAALAHVQTPVALPAGGLDPPRYRVEVVGTDPTPRATESERLAEWCRVAWEFDRLERAAFGASSSSVHAPGYHIGRPFLAPVRVNQRVTAPDHWQDVRHIELDVSSAEPGRMDYRPGDVACVFPQVPDDALQFCASRLGVRLEDRVRLSLSAESHDAAGEDAPTASMEATVEALLRGAVDMLSVSPRRYFFEVLSHFAPEAEAERLRELASVDGLDDLHEYCIRERRSVLEVLVDFPSARLPLEWVLQVVPRMQPRQFSVSSSPSAHPGRVHVTAAVVEYRTPWKRLRKGLCTHWLGGLKPGALVPLWMQPGSLRLPEDRAGLADTPMVLVGPGTGIAPLRSMLWEREAHRAERGAGTVLLFAGCRGDKDKLYADEWEALMRTGLLGEDSVIYALSREQATKVYVQHKIQEHGRRVWDLLQAGAAVYICGSANEMPADVRAALQAVVRIHGGLDDGVAASFLRAMEVQGRLQVECWS